MVSDSLLSQPVVIERTGKSVRPPAGFIAVSDSLLEVLRGTGLPGVPAEPSLSREAGDQAELAAAFLDSSRQAGLAVFVRRGLSRDDEAFATAYEAALRGEDAKAEIRSGDYIVNDIYVRNFLVSDAAVVRFHLLCFAEDGYPIELVYFSSRASYPKLVRAFESSIGTVQTAANGRERRLMR